MKFDFLSLHKAKILNEQHFCLDEASRYENKPLQLVRSACPD